MQVRIKKYQLHIDLLSGSCFVERNMASRRSFTIKEKAEIISRLKNGENNGALCKEFKVSHSTISSMWKKRDVILECFATKSSKIKRNRKSSHQDVENALLKWYKVQKSQKIIINSRVLLEKANYFAKTLGKVDFECTEGWIYRFRQRYDISVGKDRGVTRVSRNECDDWSKSKNLQETLNNMKTTQLEKVPAAELKTNSEHEQLMNQVHNDNLNQEPLNIKTVSYCCVCGEVENNFLNVIDKPYVESKKTILTLNNLNIELDFNKHSTNKTVCQNCDTKLKEIHDFLKLVKNAQEKLRHVTLDIKNEGVLNNDSEYRNTNIDTTHEDNKDRTNGYISNTESIKETDTTHKRKNNEETPSNLKKKRRFSSELDSYSTLSLHNDNDESGMDNNEIKYEFGNKKQMNPLVVTDEVSVKDVVQEDNESIGVKEEMVDIIDDYDKEVQKQGATAQLIPFEIQDTGESASNVCKEEKLDTLASLDNQMNVTNKIVEHSDILNELTSECETVGTMSKRELVVLIQSIVSQMFNEC